MDIKKRSTMPRKKCKSDRTKAALFDKAVAEAEPLVNFMFMNSWNEKKASKTFIELLCGKILEYFMDKDKLCFEEFLIANQIQETTFNRWTKEHPNLADIYSFTKMLIATRREKGMLTKELSEKSGMYKQHQYSEAWKEADAYWSELKKTDEEQERNITIVIPSLHETEQIES